MILSSLIFHSAGILKICLKSFKASDNLVKEYLQSRKYIGSNDRKFISDLVFSVLRNQSLFKTLSETLSDIQLKTEQFEKNKDVLKAETELKMIISFLVISLKTDDFNDSFDPAVLLSKMNSANYQESLEFFISDYFNLINVNVELVFGNILKNYEILQIELNEALRNDSDWEKLKELLSIRFSVNYLILESWKKANYSNEKIIDLLKSLNKSASVCLRVNSQKIDRKSIIEKLNQDEIFSEEGNLSPVSVILKGRSNISSHPFYKQGLLEIQDEGSQIISYALSPSQKAKVLDACAGAGGKTIHIAALQNDYGRITACDIEFNRLKEIKFRASRFGYKSINTLLLNKNGILPKDYFEAYDFVLVDAPCSGLGTVRRNPMPKVRISEDLISKLTENQLKILELYSKCVKSGGILVYSTCSLLPQENENIAEEFLKRNPDFEAENLKDIFENFQIQIDDLNDYDNYVTLLPSVHKSDGFFIARFRRK